MHVCLLNSSLKLSVLSSIEALCSHQKEAFPRLPFRTGEKEGGRQEQGIGLPKWSLQSHRWCAAPSKVCRSCLPWDAAPWTFSCHQSPEASQPLDPSSTAANVWQGLILPPSNAQISMTTPLGREEIVSQANCFLDCFLSPCESLTLGAIMGRGDMIRWKPQIPGVAAGA